MLRLLSSRRGSKQRSEGDEAAAHTPKSDVSSQVSAPAPAPSVDLDAPLAGAGPASAAPDGAMPACLTTIGIQSWDEFSKVCTVTFFCFTANTILLLGRNIGATMLLVGLGADALPYCMVLVGAFVTVVMPVVASVSAQYSSRVVLLWTSVIMIGVLAVFTVLFMTGLADAWPRLVYPLFFVLEEVIDSLLMVLFWQIGMLCFTKDEATRLIGIVNMGAAVANLANGVTVAILIHFFDSFAILPAQIVLLLLQLIPNHMCGRWTAGAVEGRRAAPATTSVTASKDEEGAPASSAGSPPGAPCASCVDPAAWYMDPITQLIAVWQFLTVVLFSCIEFSYNSTLAKFLDADGIAQVTANLASVASVGQTIVNLLLTPFLLQHAGVWAALLVTPIAYVAGSALVMTQQTVSTVFICRSMDFIFRYTVSDNTKQILYKAVPPHQLMEARAFIDGTIKKLGPSALGGVLIVVQSTFGLGAYELVGPMAFYLLVCSFGLMPIVLHLAEMSRQRSESSLMC